MTENIASRIGRQELVSMERRRDLRDYALIFGFQHAKDLLEMVGSQLVAHNTLLNCGCGDGIADHQAARELSKLGIIFYALDRHLPVKRYPSVRYLEGDFTDAFFLEGSVNMLWSVCCLFMYAENENEIYSQARQLCHILKPSGKAFITVDPVNFERDPAAKAIRQRTGNEVWIQSPTTPRKHFRTDIANIISTSGLSIDRRIIPNGGMMIDDEVTLMIGKRK